MELTFDEVLQQLDHVLNKNPVVGALNSSMLNQNKLTRHERKEALKNLANFLIENKLNTREILNNKDNHKALWLGYVAKMSMHRDKGLESELNNVLKILLSPKKELDPKEVEKCVRGLLLKLNPKFKKEKLDELVDNIVKDFQKEPDDPNKDNKLEALLLIRELEAFRNLYNWVPPQYQNLLTTYVPYVIEGNEQGIAANMIPETDFDSFIVKMTQNLQGQEYVIDTPAEEDSLEKAVESGLAPSMNPLKTKPAPKGTV